MRHDNLGIFNGAGSADDHDHKPLKKRRKFLTPAELSSSRKGKAPPPSEGGKEAELSCEARETCEAGASEDLEEFKVQSGEAWRSLIMDPNRPISGGPGITSKVELPPALVDDNFCCPVGPCRHYFEIILDDPEAQPEPRQWVQRLCTLVQYEQGALEITDEVIPACNRYSPPWWSLGGWKMRRIVRRRLRDAAAKIMFKSRKRPGLSEPEED